MCDVGVLKKLISLLQGFLSQRDASLESIATVIKSNPEVVSKFVDDKPRTEELVSDVTR